MKFTLCILLVFSFTAFSATDWETKYPIREKDSRPITMSEYIEACESKITKACFAGWNSQINLIKLHEPVDDFDESLKLTFLEKLDEVCKNKYFHFCEAGIEKLTESLATAKKILQTKEKNIEEQEKLVSDRGNTGDQNEQVKINNLTSDLKKHKLSYQKAIEIYYPSVTHLCRNNFKLKLNHLFCLKFYQANIDEVIKLLNDFEEECQSTKDINACDVQLNLAIKMGLVQRYSRKLTNMYEIICLTNKNLKDCQSGQNATIEMGQVDAFAKTICKKQNFTEQLSSCLTLANKEKAILKQEEKKKIISLFFVILFIGLITGMVFIIKTRCPECRKLFSYKKFKDSNYQCINCDYKELNKKNDET